MRWGSKPSESGVGEASCCKATGEAPLCKGLGTLLDLGAGCPGTCALRPVDVCAEACLTAACDTCHKRTHIDTRQLGKTWPTIMSQTQRKALVRELAHCQTLLNHVRSQRGGMPPAEHTEAVLGCIPVGGLPCLPGCHWLAVNAGQNL